MNQNETKDFILNILQQVEITTSNSGNACVKDIDSVVDRIYNTFENEKLENLEMQGCECGHTVPLEFAVGNDDGQYTCMPCYIDIVSDPEARKDFLINPKYLLVINPDHDKEGEDKDE